MFFQHDSRWNNPRDGIFIRCVYHLFFSPHECFFEVGKDVSCTPTVRNLRRNVVYLYPSRRLSGGYSKYFVKIRNNIELPTIERATYGAPAFRAFILAQEC